MGGRESGLLREGVETLGSSLGGGAGGSASGLRVEFSQWLVRLPRVENVLVGFERPDDGAAGKRSFLVVSEGQHGKEVRKNAGDLQRLWGACLLER